MPSWLTFAEGGRQFRVSGLDALRSDVAKAGFEVERLIGERVAVARTAVAHLYGRPAHDFADAVNGLLAAMVELHLVLTETVTLLGRFPEDRARLAQVVESATGRADAVPPRVEPPSGPPSRVGADVDALRRYAEAAGPMDRQLESLVRATTLDGVTAWEQRAGAGLFDGIQQAVAAVVPGMETPLDWERIDPALLVPVPDLAPLIRAVVNRSQQTAELALAVTDAFARADADLIALLERHPDLAAFVSAALGPTREGSSAAFSAVAGRDGVVTGRDIRRHQAAMRAYATVWEHLAVFDTAAKGGRPGGYISRADLKAVIASRTLPAETRKAAVLLLRRVRGGIRRNEIVRQLVDGRAFAADPDAARRFVESLPVASGGRPGLPVGLCSTEGVRALANAALASAGGSVSAQQRVIAHLPETDDGTRNELITAFYDILGDKVDAVLAGGAAGNPQAPGHPGANWLMYAPWASDGVRDVITGRMQVFGIGPRQEQRQGAADGNQWIFNDITARFAAFVELYQADPTPSAEQLERFFADHFGPGDAEIRKGFAAYVAAMAEDDPARRQALVFEGNVSVATHEQAGAQPYLEEVGAGIPDRLEVRYIDLEIGRHEIEADRSLTIEPHPSNLIVGRPILDFDPSARSVSDYSTSGAVFTTDPSVAGPGVVHLEPISGIEGFPSSMAEWHRRGGYLERSARGFEVKVPTDPDGTAGTGALSWADPHERMWTITKLFEQTHTDPSLWNTEHLGRSFDDLAWLTDQARPR